MAKLTGLYSTMDISRPQFNDIMIFRNPDEHRKKLYDDIFSRNKINHDHILAFEAEKDNFEKKVKKFKENMER